MSGKMSGLLWHSTIIALLSLSGVGQSIATPPVPPPKLPPVPPTPPTAEIASGEYKTYETDRLKIIFDSRWGTNGWPGYIPVRIEIVNLGEARNLTVVAQGNGWSGGGQEQVTSRYELSVRKGDRLKVTLPVSVQSNQTVVFNLREGGRVITPLGVASFEPNGFGRSEIAGLFVSTANEDRASGDKLFDSFVAGRNVSGFKLEPQRLPTNWLGYTSLDFVAVSVPAWEEMEPVQKEALLRWVAAGGNLVFWRVTLDKIFPDGGLPGAEKLSQEKARYFFGEIHTVPVASSEGLRRYVTSVVNEISARPGGVFFENPVAQRGFVLLLEGFGDVPRRAYAVIVFLFALVIGPLNYLLLWRKKRQIYLIVTVPAAASLFIGLLFLYTFLGQGFGTYGKCESYTILDQTAKQAATHATYSLYACGMAPAEGLKFAPDTGEMAFQSLDARMRNLELVWGQEQRFARGFMQARVAANFQQLNSGPARERVSISPEGEGFAVVNGLGVDIEALFYTKNGRLYALERRLLNGARGQLQLIGTTSFRVQEAMRKASLIGKRRQMQDSSYYSGRRSYGGAPPPESAKRPSVELSHTSKFAERIGSMPPEGTYLAILSHSPFWQPGTRGVKEREGFHLVLGYGGGEK